jgi:uncharacterized protein YihD (DUF1040 family)
LREALDSSTTQIIDWSRRGSRQYWHTSSEETLKQILQNLAFSLTSRKASASSMYDGPLQELIDALSRLPGIGPKGAQRIAFHILDAPAEEANELADATTQIIDWSRRGSRQYWHTSSEETLKQILQNLAFSLTSRRASASSLASSAGASRTSGPVDDLCC